MGKLGEKERKMMKERQEQNERGDYKENWRNERYADIPH